MQELLLIDDDQSLAQLLAQYLAQFQFHLKSASRPSEGLGLLKKEKFAAVILDVMLPEKDGFETFKDIRKFSQVPVIMLTARGDLSDRVLGLELGIDDYLPKPFEPRELAARLKTIIRRANREPSASTAKLKAGDLVLNLAARTAELAAKPLEISTLEFSLLKLFMTHHGKVLSRDQILDELRGIDWESYNRSIDVAVSRVRQKLGDSARDPKFLRTVWGEGYCFIAPVEEL